MKFHRLTVIEELGKYKPNNNTRFCRCSCECGGETIASIYELRGEKRKSCGCLWKDGTHITHGGSGTRGYNTWAALRQRCDNPNAKSYKYYGGRGITYCDRWNSFANFIADMGEPPPGRSIDRMNVNGNYEPNNCRWATAQEQRRNRRDPLRMVTWNGKTQCVTDWAVELGCPTAMLLKRIARNTHPIDRIMDITILRHAKITFDGKSLTMHEWAHELGISYGTLRMRFHRGMPIEKALQPELISNAEALHATKTIHGHAKQRGIRNRTPTYRAWCGMREKCNQPNNRNYPEYGGCGISVTPRWNDFQNFLDDMGEKPDDMGLILIDPRRNFSAANCKWAPLNEARRNQECKSPDPQRQDPDAC